MTWFAGDLLSCQLWVCRLLHRKSAWSIREFTRRSGKLHVRSGHLSLISEVTELIASSIFHASSSTSSTHSVSASSCTVFRSEAAAQRARRNKQFIAYIPINISYSNIMMREKNNKIKILCQFPNRVESIEKKTVSILISISWNSIHFYYHDTFQHDTHEKAYRQFFAEFFFNMEDDGSLAEFTSHTTHVVFAQKISKMSRWWSNRWSKELGE